MNGSSGGIRAIPPPMPSDGPPLLRDNEELPLIGLLGELMLGLIDVENEVLIDALFDVILDGLKLVEIDGDIDLLIDMLLD